VARKSKAKRTQATSSTLALVTTNSRSDHSSSSALQFPSVSVRRPSRTMDLENEAVLHFMGCYHEKFFHGRPGMLETHTTPLLEFDAARGGPVAEIMTACGLATLGSMKNAPELVMQANVRKAKVLRQLQMQLQDPEMALSSSSVLTCLFLSSIEVCSSVPRACCVGCAEVGLGGCVRRPGIYESIHGTS
jgi:hypothetical protein